MALPLVGFGTMEYAEHEGNFNYEEIFGNAISAGYRHFDTAEIYTTTQSLGKAIVNSKIERKEFFITSKIKGLPNGKYEDVKNRITQHLQALNLNYLDLLLIHSPTDSEVDFFGEPSAITEKYTLNWFKEHIKEAWENLIALKTEGLVKNIGVSNFYRAHIEELLKVSNEKPFANEIFIDTAHQQNEFVSYLQENSIHVIAYRPMQFLVSIKNALEFGAPFYDTLDQKAQSLNVSVPQLVIGYLVSRGIHVIVKSSKIENMKSNLEYPKVGAPIVLEIGEEDIETLEMAGALDEYAQSFANIN